MQIYNPNVIQKWHADGNAAVSMDSLRRLLDKLRAIGQDDEYNVIKCYLITKTKHRARKIFENDKNFVVEGYRVLGSVIGSTELSAEFLTQKKQRIQPFIGKTQ